MESNKKACWRTFNIKAWSLNELVAKYPDYPPRSYSPLSEEFANIKPLAGRYEICFTYPGSRNLKYAEQLELLKEDEKIPNASILAQALIQHFQNTDERLLASEWSRTSDADSDGIRVYVGDFYAHGLYVYRCSDGYRYSDLGLSAFRNFKPLKEGNGN